MKSEAEIQAEIQTTLVQYGCILERNNSGAFKDPTGRPVRFGLGNVSKLHNQKIKSSDLIGITSKAMTDGLGRSVVAGIFTAIEVKEESWNPNKKLDAHEQAQLNYINWVISRGGYAGFANSIEMALAIIGASKK